jgi:hypothetical protein
VKSSEVVVRCTLVAPDQSRQAGTGGPASHSLSAVVLLLVLDEREGGGELRSRLEKHGQIRSFSGWRREDEKSAELLAEHRIRIGLGLGLG